MTRLLTFILFCSSLAIADDIKFRDGSFLKNVQVTDTTDGKITVKYLATTRHFPLSTIDAITKADYDYTQPSPYYTSEQFMNDPLAQVHPAPTGITGAVIVTRPNLKLLPLSLLAVGLSWDYFAQASDLGDLIDATSKFGGDTSELESAHTRKTILGVTFLAAGIVNAYISLQSVEIKASPNSIAIAYKF